MYCRLPVLLILLSSFCGALKSGSHASAQDAKAPVLPLKARELLVDNELALAAKDILDEFGAKELSPDWRWNLEVGVTGWDKQFAGSK